MKHTYWLVYSSDKIILKQFSNRIYAEKWSEKISGSFVEKIIVDIDEIESIMIERRVALGDRIRKLREEASLTQDQLAEKTGLLKQNISRIESGKYSTGQDILSKIATALGKKLDII